MKFYTFVALIASASAIKISGVDVVNQSRMSFDAGMKTSNSVVASQESTMATYNQMHADAMDKAHKDQFNHKVSVWGPADLVSSQSAQAASRGKY